MYVDIAMIGNTPFIKCVSFLIQFIRDLYLNGDTVIAFAPLTHMSFTYLMHKGSYVQNLQLCLSVLKSVLEMVRKKDRHSKI